MNREKKIILIIDDDLTTRKVVGFAMKKCGYDIFEAETSAEGLEILNNNNVDLVLSDVVMDETDGFEFCRMIRENDKYRALPFIFITAKDTYEDRLKAFSIGADDYLTKPFNLEELKIKTQALLKRVEIYKKFGLKEKSNGLIAEKKKFLILVVDDDPVFCSIIQKAFTESGNECIVDNNAADGYIRAKEIKPDIILSDLLMPDIDGFEFRKMLSNNLITKDIPFVFLTANESENSILEGYDLNIKDYIFKGTQIKIAVAKIENILNNINNERLSVLNELQEAVNNVGTHYVSQNIPETKNFQIRQWHLPYQGIPGGDFIDYIELDDDRVLIVLGDVMGKKWRAWFFSFAFIGYIRSAIHIAIRNDNIMSVKDVLQRVNEIIYKDANVSEIYATISLILIDCRNTRIQYSGAGDLPVLYYNYQKKDVLKLKSNGLLLGVNLDGEYDNIDIDMDKNDSLILFTDGVTETSNKYQEQFGIDRLIESIRKKNDSDLIDIIKSDLNKFSNGKFDDDVTLLNISCLKQ